MMFKVDGVELFPPDKMLCTKIELETAQNIIDEKIKYFVDRLRAVDPSHPWLTKAIHAEKTERNTKELAKSLGKISDWNLELAAFMARNHDVGRIFQALVDAGDEPVKKMMAGCTDHGQMSTRALTIWGVFNVLTGYCAPVVQYVLTHHSDVSAPAVSPKDSKEVLWQKFFLTLVRLSDKVATMIGRTDYYLSVKGVNEQSPLLEKELAKAGKTFLGETGCISPEVFAAFVNRQTFERTLCVSYEDYMVNYLAWIFDIRVPQVLDVVAQSGYVDKIVGYLRRQGIDSDVVETIEAIVKDYFVRIYSK